VAPGRALVQAGWADRRPGRKSSRRTGATASRTPVTSGSPSQSRIIGEKATTGTAKESEIQNRRRNSSACARGPAQQLQRVIAVTVMGVLVLWHRAL
jgi:hypothetical protein